MASVHMGHFRIRKMKIKKSANASHLIFVIHTDDNRVFEFEIHQGLAWRMRHRIHKLLGFDDQEIDLGRRYARFQGMDNQ